jgi:hypothetical protein
MAPVPEPARAETRIAIQDYDGAALVASVPRRAANIRGTYATLTAEMQFRVLSRRLALGCLFLSITGLQAQEQSPPPSTQASAETAAKDAAAANARRGMPPRIAPTEYQTHAKVGDFTIAADFDEHSIPTPDGTFTSEEYVAVEAAFFGPEASHIKLAIEDFSLQINDRKVPLPSQAYALLFHSLADPEWQPPKQPDEDKGSKTGINTGGRGNEDKPPPPKMPRDLRRAMEQKVLKVVMPEGDRPAPVAGLLFFQYRGKSKNIKTMSLVYNGAAGTVTIPLQP